jgi:glutamate racemase
VDVIVLGCTHYPFARAAVERLAGPGVQVIDPAPAVARQAARLLAAGGQLRATDDCPAPGSLTFLTSGEAAALRRGVALLAPPGWATQATFGVF